MRFKDRLITRARRVKLKLMARGGVAAVLVPFVEIYEFWLSHGFKEVTVRSRLRLSKLRQPAPVVSPQVTPVPTLSTSAVRLIAFYLPQFHPIPENDRAWGKGFTEWTNVTRARPLFPDHYQPHLPADLGFYDLRVAETRAEQAAIARAYGIYGFCYYYYWFDRQRLLSRPLDDVIASGQPDFPFCICWANEPWSRRWDGSEHEIIAAQEYRPGYEERFIEDVIPILRDPRYIRVDGRPLLVVYRVDHLPHAAAAVVAWREACRRAGIGEICLAAMGTYGTTDPRPAGFDVSIEFPPHNLTDVPTIEEPIPGLAKDFGGRILDYRTCVEHELRRRPPYPQFRGAMTGWDNTARRGPNAMLFHHASPAAYKRWLRGLLGLATAASAPYAPHIFINAWNEWAEGAHLEPDQRFGRAFLEATASALLEHQHQTLFERGFDALHGAKPDISIVVPVYNHIELTLACLDSLARHRTRWRVEVIVVDDGSQDLSATMLSSVPGLRYLRNHENRGFVRSCNLGAAAATGDYVVFLNNDTTVEAEWLDELRATFDGWPDAGLVGSKLVWPNGRIQECGSLIYRDGSAENFGREGDPRDPQYCYAREADYVTGAAIMISRERFEKLGGFDERYVPAYYEDVDLAFRVREAGLRVVVNPRAVVIHHEGGTSGTDVRTGVKQYQVINHKKFQAKWSSALVRFPARDGRPRTGPRENRVLVIDWVVPRPDRDAGSVRMAAILRILRNLHYQVTFVSRDGSYDAANAAALERIGVEVLRQPHLQSMTDYLTRCGRDFGHVIVSRRDVAILHLEAVRALCPEARVIFDTVDLHFLRESRQQTVEVEETVALAAHFHANRQREVELIRMSDVTLVVSEYERQLLKGMFPDLDVRIVSLIQEPTPTRRTFAERVGLLFVGFFVHTPNVDAVRWFVREVLPHITIDEPGFQIHIVGSEPPADILAMASDRVKVHGYVPDIETMFDACKMSIAPLRYGAGIKGKIAQSLALGVPCVTTSIGAEGMALEDGTSAMIADTAIDFAAKIERLYHDENLWLRLRDHGFEVIERDLSMNVARRELDQLFGSTALTR